MLKPEDLRLPSYYEIEAEEAWTSIDFISDLHLNPEDPQTFEAWSSYMRQTRADAVFILGDLFEVWVGDDAVGEPFEARCLEVLSEAACRRTVGLMHGNRDFLVGADLLKRSGLIALSDPTMLSAWEQRVLLTHGDRFCIADEPYQAFRNQVRSRPWQEQFLAQDLPARQQQAQAMRKTSQMHQSQRGADDWIDADPAMMVSWMHQAGSRQLVHGHTHHPGSEVLAPGYSRHVLSDWAHEQGRVRAEVLRLTRDGFVRLEPQRA